eukprot:9877048-Alexandrium_andersonii.AAC.1
MFAVFSADGTKGRDGFDAVMGMSPLLTNLKQAWPTFQDLEKTILLRTTYVQATLRELLVEIIPKTA